MWAALFFWKRLVCIIWSFFNHKTTEHYLKIESLDRLATFFEGVYFFLLFIETCMTDFCRISPLMPMTHFVETWYIIVGKCCEGSSAAHQGSHRLWKDFGISLPCPLDPLALWIAWIAWRITPNKYVNQFFIGNKWADCSILVPRDVMSISWTLPFLLGNLADHGPVWPKFLGRSIRRPICGWPAAPDPPPARCCWRPPGNWPRKSMRRPWNSPAPLASAAPARLDVDPKCLGVEFSLGYDSYDDGIWGWNRCWS